MITTAWRGVTDVEDLHGVVERVHDLEAEKRRRLNSDGRRGRAITRFNQQLELQMWRGVR